MSKVNLCDICDFQGGSQPPKSQWITLQQDGYIRMLQIRDFTQPGKVKAEYVKLTNTTKCCLKDDILIARYGASLGKILTGLSGAYNVAMTKAVPNEAVISKKFLYYFLCSDTFQNCILNVGVRAAQAGFNKEDLSNIELYCPDLSIQNKICKILELVDVLINKSKLQLDELDLLVKSRFVEMFGDPKSNPKGWNKKTLSEIITKANNGMARRGNDESGSIVLRLVELQGGFIDYSKPNRIILTEKEQEKYLLQENDILFARVNGNPLNVGRCAVFHTIDEAVYHNDHIIRVHFDDSLINGVFASNILNSEYGKDQLKNKIKTSAGQYTISQDGIGAIESIMPPIELQNQYADFVAQVDKSKLAIQKSLDELEILKKSLMQQYFG